MGALIERIEILCFAGSYTVALALELARLVTTARWRSVLTIAWMVAGLLAHTVFLASRTIHGGAAPLSSAFDWYLVAAWLLAAGTLYSIWQHPRAALPLFVLPLTLGLVAVATFLADRQPFPVDSAVLWWGILHGSFLLLGTIAVLIGFVAGLMYLLQASRLKRKRPVTRTFEMPSLEWLQRTNTRAMVLATLLLSVGLLSGSVLNLVQQRHDLALVPWSDPVVWSSCLTLVWLLVAVVFAAFYKPARMGRKVAYLTLASFLFLAFSLGVGLFFTTHGSGASPASPDADTTTAPRDAAAASLRLARGVEVRP